MSLMDAAAVFLVGLFAISAVLWTSDRDKLSETARYSAIMAWVCFGVFWVALTPYFLFTMHSFVEGGLALLALPVCLHIAYCLYNGRTSMMRLSTAITVMGGLYLTASAFPSLYGYPAPRQVLIEVVASHTMTLLEVFGFDPEIQPGPNGYTSEITFPRAGATYNTYIELACTAIGSISIFAGVLAASEGDRMHRFGVFMVVAAVIYVLNLFRNAFVAAAYGWQLLQVHPEMVADLAGYSSPAKTSFFISHNVIAQPLSVIVIVALVLGVARLVPGAFVLVDEILYAVTRQEFDLASSDN